MYINVTDQEKTGVLLINTGSPVTREKIAVKRYLRHFLMDGRVIDKPAILRWLLVHLLIVPLRAQRVTNAYQSIWREEGAPLLYYTEKFAKALQMMLGSRYQVAVGMRYSQPSIEKALLQLTQSSCTEIVVFPLYPQYSSAASGSAIEAVWDIGKKLHNIPVMRVIPSFYSNSGFISAYAENIKTHLENVPYEYVLFSYHGLPVRHVEKSEADSRICDKKGSCPSISEKNHFCYRAQCYETTRLLSEALQLTSRQCGTAFQSRLGITPWIKPYTDQMLKQLRRQDVKDLAIVCPSFVSDCLETLEEIGIRAQDEWTRLGGHTLSLVPCLNDANAWVKAAADLVVGR